MYSAKRRLVAKLHQESARAFLTWRSLSSASLVMLRLLKIPVVAVPLRLS